MMMKLDGGLGPTSQMKYVPYPRSSAFWNTLGKVRGGVIVI